MVVTPIVDIPVYRQNQSEMRSPWTGGINAAQVSMFDSDYDGNETDIFVFDKAGNRILVFKGEMENGELAYTYKPELAKNFPKLKAWALLRDFDCDGKKDIFTYSPAGGSFAVYRNTGSAETGISFELETESILTYYNFASNQFDTNIYVSSQDMPAIFDFDGDGDLDILTFNVNGTMVELHINYSMENTGSCGLDDFELKNRCYGRFVEGFDNNQIIQDPESVDAACTFNVLDPRFTGNEPDTTHRGYRHAGSTILAFDANQDGLPDLVLGDVTYTNLSYLENNSRPAPLVDSVGAIITDFPANFGAPEVNMVDFLASFYEDVSGDGVRDLLVGVNNPYSSSNKKSVWYYKNVGEDDLPQFELIQKDFLQDETIDYGEGSAPAFFDYNGNGLLDMVIGSRGEFIEFGVFKPTLALYENTGTANAPEFTLVDEDWLSVSALNIGQYITPTFGDIDGDGDMDLMVGCQSGEVYLFTNSAGAGNTAAFALTGKVKSGGEPIDVGMTSTPQLYDLDQNGKLDLIIGARNGNLTYYKNTGTLTQPEFTFITDNLGGISSVEPNYFIGNSSPFFYNFEDVTYLVVGGEAGKVHLYDGIDNNLDGDFNLIDLNAFRVDVGLLSRPVVYDLNNDGLPDLICGGVGGGINLFLGDYLVSAGNIEPGSELLKVYPNPSSDVVRFELPETNGSSISYCIYALSGKAVVEGSLRDPEINVAPLPNGMYIIEVIQNDKIYRGKFVKN